MRRSSIGDKAMTVAERQRGRRDPLSAIWRPAAPASKRAKKAAGTRKARAEIEAIRAGHKDRIPQAIKAVRSRSMLANSHQRLFDVLRLIHRSPPEVFWPAFLDSWHMCDATWYHQDLLLRVLEAQSPSLPFLTRKQRSLHKRLPARVRVFRGSSRERVRGVSWTRSRRVAEGFARGHRGIPVPDPVVAISFIPKEAIFFVDHNRKEREIVLDPDKLEQITVLQGGSAKSLERYMW